MLVVALNSLHNNFGMIIVTLPHLGNKDLGEMQLIVISIEVVNLVKQVISITRDLAMMAKKKRPQ